MPYDPPATPACEGQDPWFFEDPFAHQYALDICALCPVRLWCLNQVDPARMYFDGVAGGHVWKDGELVRSWLPDKPDPVLVTYLTTNRITKKLQDPNE